MSFAGNVESPEIQRKTTLKDGLVRYASVLPLRIMNLVFSTGG